MPQSKTVSTAIIVLLLLGTALTSSDRLGFSEFVFAANGHLPENGPQPSAETKAVAQSFSKDRAFRYVIFKLTDNLAQIEPEKPAPISATYQDFLKALPQNQPRYALYYLDAKENKGKSKIVFISWAPDHSKIKDKMAYNSSRNVIRAVCSGVELETQGTNLDELSYAKLLEKAAS